MDGPESEIGSRADGPIEGGAGPALGRRRFMRRLGRYGALGGLLGAGGHTLAEVTGVHSHGRPMTTGEAAASLAHDRAPHGSLGTAGSVDHKRNGFDPHAVLTDFDGGTLSKDASGRTVREFEFVAIDKRIEVAPGLFFPAWTYNGRVPGPTIRATEGDRVVIHFLNSTSHPHTIHFHGFHSPAMDGVPGQGEVGPGGRFTYDFVAGPFGTHLYHCHSLPLRSHLHRGLYGAFIVDPPEPRPPAHEMVMVLNAFDVNFDTRNEVYAANTVAFAYSDKPIAIRAGELQRLHVVNVTEFDAVNSLHLHANFFRLFRTGTSLTPHELTDTVTMGQAERHMLEFEYRSAGLFMFHAHQTDFVELGWMSAFQVD